MHPRIEIVDVADNLFGEQAIESFGDASENHVTLEDLQLSGDRLVDSRGGKALGKMLRGAPSLRNLPLPIQAVGEVCSAVHEGEKFLSAEQYSTPALHRFYVCLHSACASINQLTCTLSPEWLTTETGNRRFVAKVQGRRLEITEMVGSHSGNGKRRRAKDDEEKGGTEGETLLRAVDGTSMESSIVFCRY